MTRFCLRCGARVVSEEDAGDFPVCAGCTANGDAAPSEWIEWKRGSASGVVETTFWNGQQRYNCPFCAYDTYSRAQIGKHIQWNHACEVTGCPTR